MRAKLWLALAIVTLSISLAAPQLMADESKESATKWCPDAEVAVLREKFRSALNSGDYDVAESIIKNKYEECSSNLISSASDINDEDEAAGAYWLVSDYLELLAKQKKFTDCVREGNDYVYWGYHRDHINSRPYIKEIRAQYDHCLAARNESLGFSSENACWIDAGLNFKVVPTPATWGRSARKTHCFAVSVTRKLTDDEFEDQEEVLSDTQYPYLVESYLDRNGVFRNKRYDFNDGLLGQRENCGDLTVQAGGDAEHHRLRITGYVSYCWPGNAALLVDSVYELRDGALYLVDDLTAGIH